jgi:hypothetical protein
LNEERRTKDKERRNLSYAFESARATRVGIGNFELTAPEAGRLLRCSKVQGHRGRRLLPPAGRPATRLSPVRLRQGSQRSAFLVVGRNSPGRSDVELAATLPQGVTACNFDEQYRSLVAAFD